MLTHSICMEGERFPGSWSSDSLSSSEGAAEMEGWGVGESLEVGRPGWTPTGPGKANTQACLPRHFGPHPVSRPPGASCTRPAPSRGPWTRTPRPSASPGALVVVMARQASLLLGCCVFARLQALPSPSFLGLCWPQGVRGPGSGPLAGPPQAQGGGRWPECPRLASGTPGSAPWGVRHVHVCSSDESLET